ncbi:unnamed protein product [Schistosoma curassoni]|uniref:Ovule protein n=1 Tax=Schistosoma curassoni TaxID=6186 RepID=A0A183JGW7_9TREM|nr:unnamed protein product [Schistosoma curassoni]
MWYFCSLNWENVRQLVYYGQYHHLNRAASIHHQYPVVILILQPLKLMCPVQFHHRLLSAY